MLSSTRGIIFHTVPYSDSRVIAKVYTEQYGLRSFIVTVSKSRKGKVKNSVLQPLTMVELVTDMREQKSLQSAREITCYAPYLHMHEDLVKTSIALFIAEILYKAVREEESNPQLFAFLTSSLQILDLKQESVANFHLCFLLQLSKFLGFYPHANTLGSNSVFDLRDGVFKANIPPHPMFLEIAESRLLEKLMSLSFENMHELPLNGETRSMIVKHLLVYYELHMSSVHDVKSHLVLEAVLG